MAWYWTTHSSKLTVQCESARTPCGELVSWQAAAFKEFACEYTLSSGETFPARRCGARPYRMKGFQSERRCPAGAESQPERRQSGFPSQTAIGCEPDCEEKSTGDLLEPVFNAKLDADTNLVCLVNQAKEKITLTNQTTKHEIVPVHISLCPWHPISVTTNVLSRKLWFFKQMKTHHEVFVNGGSMFCICLCACQ